MSTNVSTSCMGAEAPAPLRVLHVLKDLKRHGGTPRKLASIVRHTDTARTLHSFLVFNDCADSLAADIRAMECTVKSVHRPSRWDLRLAWDIVRAAREDPPDVLFTHFARADIVGALVGRYLRIPVVKYVHEIHGNDSRAIQLLEGALDSFRALTVYVSEATRRAKVAEGSTGPKVVLPNGVPDEAVDLDELERTRIRGSLGASECDFLVCHAGSLIALRRQELLVDAVALLRKSGASVRLVIAGEGPQRRALELQIVAAGLTSAVSLLGERSDVRQIMAASDAYVNMTDEEGFGIAVVEAMQASIPVVLADAGALPELICDGQDGILVRSGDANALFRALSTLMADPAYARRLGQSARRRALERFSIERYLAGLEGVLTSVAAGRSTRGPSGGDAQSMRARGDAS